jgi:hypothetical protein
MEVKQAEKSVSDEETTGEGEISDGGGRGERKAAVNRKDVEREQERRGDSDTCVSEMKRQR